ncbi:MAG TPA: hypothetical protein VME01_08465 [Solirubrobacteraceae bacterium]|nr:hypothetical protein [Solirubrobacteraceae bacterium]
MRRSLVNLGVLVAVVYAATSAVRATRQAVPNSAETQLWQRPGRLGSPESMKGLGGVVAPLLAGFALSAIVVLLSTTRHPRLWQPAVLALALAVALLLYSMQVAFYALQHYASPLEWLGWYPEATVNIESLSDIRERQAREQARFRAISGRHAWSYELGLLCFLAGLGLLLWPNFPRHHQFPIWPVLATGAVALAFAVEVWWMVARQYNGRQERRGGSRRLPHPAAFRDIKQPDLRRPSDTSLAAVLDPERRTTAKRWFPDLSRLPPDR